MPIIHLTLFGKRVGQLIVLEGSLVVRMHRGVGLTSLQGDISFSDMRLSYCPAKRCQNF